MHEVNRAMVFVPDMIAHKMLTHGVVLPEGYEIVPGTLQRNPGQSIGFVVESEHLPHTVQGTTLPTLFIEDLGSHVGVGAWKE